MLLGTVHPPVIHLSENKETSIMRVAAMVMTAHSTDLTLTMIVHILDLDKTKRTI